MNCELLATCSALGYLEGDTYHKEPDCLESVKDLIRYLRHEDETRDVRQQLGAAQILQGDLLPLLTQHRQDKPLFDAVVRLMVNLTQPALLCFGKVPQDPNLGHHFLQVLTYLRAYKEAFASEKVFGVLSETLYELLQLGWEERQEEDNLLIERILLLVRNLLHIPADPDHEKPIDDSASTHDRLLWSLHLSGLDDLLLFLASSPAEQQWSLHVLEIIALLFRDQNPERLAADGQARSAQARRVDVRELEALRQREVAERKSRAFRRGSRHSRFGGSYVVQGLRAIGDQDVVYHKGLHSFQDYSPDLVKEVRRVPRRRQVAQETVAPRRSARNVRLFLGHFCTEFLENSYNRLMALVKDHLLRERAQQHDETYYLWALAFFMAFNRASRFRPGLVSETLSVRTFHFIEQNLTNYYEMMLTDRREAVSWGRRMHLALKAYQELLATVHQMDQSEDEAVRESSRIIKNNIFYVLEFRELFLALFRKFDETRQPRSFLCDLVETTHLFLKMLEHFCQGRGSLMVQNKKRRRRRKKGRVPPTRAGTLPLAPEQQEELWTALEEQLRRCARDPALPTDGVVPFDAASEVPVEEQRTEAMVRIQESLLGGQAAAALSLLRAAREVWPEGDVFGAPELSAEEEVQLLGQILSASLPRRPEAAQPGGAGEEEEGEEEEEAEGEEEAEEELQAVQVAEREFNFLDYLRRFASSTVVRAYTLLLRSYRHNSPHTNHCVVKMLHRLARDLKMDALLFQLSLFCLFHRLLSDPAAPAYQELVTFAKYILGRFFTLAAGNSKAFVELLFWKNTSAVREMTEGYGSLGGDGPPGHRPLKWSPEEERQLQELYLAHKDVDGEDVVDAILARLGPARRTRRQVIHHLVRLGLADSVKDFQKPRGTQLVLWTEEQELELRRLFEEFRDSDDVLGGIMRNLTAKRSRARVVDKLLSSGLVAERRELYKKRSRRKAQADGKEALQTSCQRREEKEEAEEEEEEEEEEPEGEEEMGAERGRCGPSGLERNLWQEGFSGPLQWLQNCLIRVATDREEDGCSQAVPLVPLTEENEEAMEDRRFRRLLRRVGARPPASEQESFWRIPAKLSARQLRRMAASLGRPREDGAPGQDEAGGAPDGGPPHEEPRTPSPQALLQARKRRGVPGSGRRQPLDSDEEQEEEEEAGTALEPGPPAGPQLLKRRRLRIEDDDDDD
ncbi:protein timeless homolog [Tachyglossus aculeatus]|uniref:protein timeless homolog n=1 Tax=Tachyglossus aculeatus TaxID=9261 RepID=UPI0018F6CBE1|nr:protein timeless homolog [Tachyglossus aculeatus]